MKTSPATRWPLAAAVWALAALLCQAEVPPPEPAQEAESAPSSVTPADLEASPLARLAKAIEEGDAETVAAFVRFPLKRQYPIPPIADAGEFVDYFPTLFDEAFRAQMREGQFAEDWREMGWRGTCYGGGDIWVDGTLADGGMIFDVCYRSEAEQRLRAALVEEERQTLPPSLAETCDPVFSFQTEDGEFVGRVDRREDGFFRIALFPGPAQTGQLLPRSGCDPSAVFAATAVHQGDGGYHVYLDVDGRHALEVPGVGSDETPELELYERLVWSDAFENGRRARYCQWKDLLEPPTDPNDQAAPALSPADAIRAFFDGLDHPYRESRSGDTTVFSHALAVDVGRPRFTADILVRDGSPFLLSRALLPERIPADRRHDVAQCLLDLNRQRAAGAYRLDWRKRRVYCEFYVPAEYFSPDDDPANALLFAAGPVLWLDDNLPRVLAAAGLQPDPVETGTEPASPSAVAPAPPRPDDADDPSPAVVDVIPESEPGEAPASEDAPDANGADSIWVAPLVQQALERQGSHPNVDVDVDDQKVTFQFPSIIRGSGLFSRVTVSMSATENWVYVLLSPDIRVSDALRAPVAEWAMRVTGPGDRAAFAWLEEVHDLPRIAAKTVCPAQFFADDPDRALLLLLRDAAAVFDRHSRSLAAVLSGLLPPAKALAASREPLPSP
jgi:hypothetical protein